MNQKRMVWADVVRVVAMFLVVVVHVVVAVVGKWQRIPSSWWWAGNVYGSVAHVCVPWLVMLSGGLLLPKRESYKEFFGKRVMRVVRPWFFWSLVYLLWKVYEGDFVPGVSWLKLWWQTFMGNFWLLPVLVGLYLLTPLLRQWLRVARARDVIYALGLWWLVAVVNPFVVRFSQVGRLVGLIPTLEHLGYYLLGYVIVVDGWGKKWWRMSGVVAVIGVVAVSVVTFRLTGFKGGFDEWFWDYVSVGIVVASVAGLVWLKGWVEKHGDGWNNGVVEGVERLSKLTLSIYFVHIWVLEVAREMFGVGELRFHPAVSIPVISGLVFGGSWVLVEIMRRVRGLGWWVV